MRRLGVAALCGALLLVASPGHASQSCAELPPDSMELALCKAEAAKALASKGGPLAPKLLEDAAMQLVSVWNGWGRDACEQEDKSCARHAASLFEAATTFASIGKVAQVLRLGNAILSPESKIHEPDVVLGAAELVTNAYLDLGMVAQAAKRLGDVAERLRGAEVPEVRRAAFRLLSDAHRLWLINGDRALAAKARKTLIEARDPLDPYVRRDLDLDDATVAIADLRWQDAIDILTAALLREKNTNLQWELAARALLARAHQESGDERAAVRVDRELLLRWQKRSNTEHVYWAHIDAVAEALLRDAERKRIQATAGPPPSPSNVDAWSKRQRRKVIPDVIAAFSAVEQLDPPARPRWRVAAAAGKADTWRRFDQIIVSATGKGTPARMVVPTLAAFEACTALSRELKYFGAETQACETGVRAYAPKRAYDALWFAPVALPEGRYEPTFSMLDGTVVRRRR